MSRDSIPAAAGYFSSTTERYLAARLRTRVNRHIVDLGSTLPTVGPCSPDSQHSLSPDYASSSTIWHSTTSQDRERDEDQENETKSAFGDHDTEKPEHGSSQHYQSHSFASSSSPEFRSILGRRRRDRKDIGLRRSAHLVRFLHKHFLIAPILRPAFGLCCN